MTGRDAPPLVVGEGLRLRRFDDTDAAALERAFLDEAIAAWNPGPAASAASWAANRNDWSSRDHASWAVADVKDELVGSVSLHHIDWDQADAEVGYWTAPWARARGVATSALRLATWFAHEDLRLRRVYLYHAVTNEPSCRVATAAGYGHEGTLRQSHRYADGRYHDEHLHAHLASDPGIAAATVSD
jgi:RimJ/RimL family protein N-acetyltransferase